MFSFRDSCHVSFGPCSKCSSPRKMSILKLQLLLTTNGDNRPSPELLKLKLERWKGRYLSMESELRQATPFGIKECDTCCTSLYPNIFDLQKIAHYIPVTSDECERRAIKLHRLKMHLHESTKPRASPPHYYNIVDLDVETSVTVQSSSR